MTGFGKLQFVSARVKVRHSRRVLRLAGIDRETDAWKANAGRSAQRDRIPLGFTAPPSPATPFTPHGVVEGASRVQPRDRRAGGDPRREPTSPGRAESGNPTRSSRPTPLGRFVAFAEMEADLRP